MKKEDTQSVKTLRKHLGILSLGSATRDEDGELGRSPSRRVSLIAAVTKTPKPEPAVREFLELWQAGGGQFPVVAATIHQLSKTTRPPIVSSLYKST